jgi:transposase-like protein
MIAALRTVIKRMHYPLEVMLTCARWYVSYPLSFRHLEEMMEERGVVVDHATIHRWAIKIETMHMIRKGQIDCHDEKSCPPLISFIP